VAGPAGRLRASVPLQSVTRSLARSRVNTDPRARGLGQGVLDIVRTACGLQRLRGEGEESEDQGAEALGVPGAQVGTVPRARHFAGIDQAELTRLAKQAPAG